jgi:Na+-driven multidrug efflux pump
MGLVFFFGADGIFRFMHDDPLVWEAGVPALKLLVLFEVPLVMSIVYVFSLRGAGDTVYPLYFSTVGVIFVRVPLAYLLAIVLKGGLVGAWIAMGVDLMLQATFATVRYQRGRWLETRV